MPLPFGHSLMGYALYKTMPQETRVISWRMFLLFVLLANLPDIDYLPGFLQGNPNKFHHHFTHSLGFTVMVGWILATYSYLKKRKRFLTYFLMFAGVCFSHVVLDFLTADYSQPYGVPLFLPFSNRYFISPITVFMSIDKSNSSNIFIQSLFVMHNFWAALWEIVVFIPVLSIINLRNKRRKWLPNVAK